MRILADGWSEFEGGELAKCPAPASKPRYAGHCCGRWLVDVGLGLLYRVRIHPRNGLDREPKPTAPLRCVQQCWKCETHLEVEVVAASSAAVA